MDKVIVGGVITLIVTLLVQVFVVPRVQIANRRRERWEDDVLALRALLEEELPRRHENLRSTGYQLRFLLTLKDAEDIDPTRFKQVWQSESAGFRDTRTALGELMGRLAQLEGRVRLVHSTAPYWRQLELSRRRLRLSTFQVELDPDWGEVADLDDEAWENEWKKVREVRETMLAWVKQVADPMKPPRTYPVRRVRLFVAARIQKHLIQRLGSGFRAHASRLARWRARRSEGA